MSIGEVIIVGYRKTINNMKIVEIFVILIHLPLFVFSQYDIVSRPMFLLLLLLSIWEWSWVVSTIRYPVLIFSPRGGNEGGIFNGPR